MEKPNEVKSITFEGRKCTIVKDGKEIILDLDSGTYDLNGDPIEPTGVSRETVDKIREFIARTGKSDSLSVQKALKVGYSTYLRAMEIIGAEK